MLGKPPIGRLPEDRDPTAQRHREYKGKAEPGLDKGLQSMAGARPRLARLVGRHAGASLGTGLRQESEEAAFSDCFSVWGCAHISWGPAAAVLRVGIGWFQPSQQCGGGGEPGEAPLRG